MYSLFVSLSITIGLLLSIISLKKIGLSKKHIIVICISISASFIAGARLLNYMIRYSDYKMLGISLFTPKLAYFSLYGGIIAVLIMLILVSLVWKLDILRVLDALTLPFLLSFAIMKIGCYLNGCCYGTFTNSWIGIALPTAKAEELANSKLFSIVSQTMKLKVYPTQFMEMSAALLIASLIVIFKKKLYKGATFFSTALSFSFARLIILPYRASIYAPVVTELVYPTIYIIIIVTSMLLLVYLKP